MLCFQSRVLRFQDLGVFVFEVWVLRASVFVFETTPVTGHIATAFHIFSWVVSFVVGSSSVV